MKNSEIDKFILKKSSIQLETSKFEPKLGPKIPMRTEAFKQDISFFTHISLNCITHIRTEKHLCYLD